MQELFERIGEMQEEKVTEITLSYLEIYNETIRDLLVPGGSKQGLMLREDANQAVSVAGLSSHRPQNVSAFSQVEIRGLTPLLGTRGHGHNSPRQRVSNNVADRSKCYLLSISCCPTDQRILQGPQCSC